MNKAYFEDTLKLEPITNLLEFCEVDSIENPLFQAMLLSDSGEENILMFLWEVNNRLFLHLNYHHTGSYNFTWEYEFEEQSYLTDKTLIYELRNTRDLVGILSGHDKHGYSKIAIAQVEFSAEGGGETIVSIVENGKVGEYINHDHFIKIEYIADIKICDRFHEISTEEKANKLMEWQFMSFSVREERRKKLFWRNDLYPGILYLLGIND